ncbi:flagellar protein FlaG [Alkalihalobacillus alcalophilus ATCC 27647 = CGMCC 1.3604]|uniref:Flagellar protein FlaG n=1 Tax=Alkalihalobacillus alcalophilus ATCC 27647 = CGMCC 1.3604 TaxID=1218173 RepID=A0A4S4JTJ0_ALKAL|nr:flagellar protein FlaG [Alkalihalobacillus alcalophilus]MED1561542.1 flagellar protein FlaG [Alkalihalobacillus alcalophilus]THG88443.1 flagellar protein FlaG [Alkalihalobacillus alcalophilus ATCC 27647 = CGMCC 1.3604]
MEIKPTTDAYALFKAKPANDDAKFKFNFETPTSIVTKGETEFKKNYQGAIPAEVLMKKVDSMNELLKSNQTAVKFNVHDDLDRIYVQLISRDTDEVIKEIPPEMFLDMVASMLRNAGLIVDERI